MARSSSSRSPSQKAPKPGRARSDEGDVAGLGKWRAGAFVAPALLLVAVFLVFPALWTLYLGLTNYQLTGPAALHPQFVGLDNYIDAVSGSRFLNSLGLTLIFVFCSGVIGQSVLGFALAWFMTRMVKPARSVLEFFVLLAWVIPASVKSFLWIALLDRDNGTLNAIFGSAHMAWLLDYPMQSIIVFNIWDGTAFSMLLFGSALASIPPSQLESARMAGAGAIAQIRDVVFPFIRGHVLTNTLLITLWTFNTFTPFLLTAGGPNHESEILPVYIYRLALQNGELGAGSAISLILLLINLVIAFIYLRLLREKKRS